MDDLLLLVHRIPYPPNKGDKIRSYHLLRGLSRHFRVHLGAFVDDPADWEHARAVAELARGGCLLRPLHPFPAKLRALRGLGRNQALTLPYYRDPIMTQWVGERLEAGGIRWAMGYSSAMAQYLPPRPGMGRVLDFVDADSQKFRQYGREQGGLMGWLYRREGRLLLEHERRVAATFQRCWFVTPEEAGLFHGLAPESRALVHHWENGVDARWFDPGLTFPDPYPAGGPVLVFTGAMDYRPNVDAVRWFAEAIFPGVREWLPEARFVIVGSRPTGEVTRLGQRPGVVVTGRVADVRPYLAHAAAAVAPLRMAQGVQNKVLEAMSMGKPVLATRKAMEGIRPCPELARWVSDHAEEQVRSAVDLLHGEGAAAGAAGRRWVLRHYDWETNLEPVLAYLLGGGGATGGGEGGPGRPCPPAVGG